MARGSVVWHCSKCGNRTRAACRHLGAKYYAVYPIGTKQKWEPVSRNKKDAESRLADALSDLQAGKPGPPKPVLFRDFTDQWLRDYAQGTVKLFTFRFYCSLIKVHLNPAFGGSLLTQITPQHVQGFLAKCLQEKHLSPKTTNSVLITLKTIFKHARQWDLVRDNPADPIRPVRTEPKEMAFLHPDEIPPLLKHADEPYRTLFLMAILTGMRRGEILGLQWGDIDWHSNLIHVRRTLYYHTKEELVGQEDTQKWRFSTPKSLKSNRTIEMSPRLREALELHRLISPRSSYDLVFCTPQGKPLHAENMVKREFLPALSRAGLRRVRFHDLRHTYTTLLLAQGVNVKLIQAQLGHASIQTTLDRYGHLLPEAHLGFGKGLDDLIFKGGPPAKADLKEPAQMGAIDDVTVAR